MTTIARPVAALRASLFHLGISCLVAAGAAALVFGLWFPFPYRYLSGGRELFLLIVAVDVVSGPLLTAVLFSPTKPRKELWLDLSIVVLLQLGTLGYGLYTVQAARPLYLVLELDRFKVISANVLQNDASIQELRLLPPELKPSYVSGPRTIAIREPVDESERKKVLFESVEGGRDYAERPNFYIPYDSVSSLGSLRRAKSLSVFLEKQPTQQSSAIDLATTKGVDIQTLMYLPVVSRQDWIAVLNRQGQIQGFLKGDGF